jgi:hypothetical protein
MICTQMPLSPLPPHKIPVCTLSTTRQTLQLLVLLQQQQPPQGVRVGEIMMNDVDEPVSARDVGQELGGG